MAEAPQIVPTPSRRIDGLDVARALAICGMTLIHGTLILAMNADDSSWLAWFGNRLAGRPAMIFMLLAGIGISLRQQPDESVERTDRIRGDLRRRGLFLVAFGVAFLVVWDADILRVYGLGFLLASALLTSSNAILWGLSVGAVVTSLLLMALVPFETNWNFETFDYQNLWTLSGGLMQLFYNGTRAVFPWIGVLLVGMLIGRKDLRDPRVLLRLLFVGLAAWIVTEFFSHQLVTWALEEADDVDPDDIRAIFGTDSFPSLPLFLFSSGGLSLVVIVGCVALARSLPPACWRPLAALGRMAFTWYIGHVLALFALHAIFEVGDGWTLPRAYLVSAALCTTMIVTSALWQRRFRFGPLEWLLRTTSRSRSVAQDRAG